MKLNPDENFIADLIGLKVLTDEGEQFAVVADASKMKVQPNSLVRIVSNYAPAEAGGTKGVKLYGCLPTVSPLPMAPDKFEDGIKKTIQWYLDNKEWWETIISGEYQNYYEKMYSNR